jgi:hypothetical protein
LAREVVGTSTDTVRWAVLSATPREWAGAVRVACETSGRAGAWCTTGTGAAPAATPIAAVAAVAAATLLAEIVAAAAGSPLSQDTTRRSEDVTIAHTAVGRLPE